MDYSCLLSIHSLDHIESQARRYKEIKDSRDISPAGKIEFERAKSILSVVSPKTNLSLYDHLGDILRRVLRFGIEDGVDNLEDISRSIKDEKRSPETEIIEGILLDENLQKMIEEKKLFYKLSPIDERKPAIKPSTIVDEEDMDAYEEEDESEEKDTEDEDLPDLAASLPDLHHKIGRFRLGGIGLSDEEVHDLNVALRNLAQTYKLEKVEFWGKMFANQGNYYIAECPYQSNVPRESFGYEEKKEELDDENLKEDSIDEENSESDDATEEENVTDEEETETEEEKKIPPIPKPNLKKQAIVPPEEDGTGINEYLYFVTMNIVGKWRCLPSLRPQHITAAKRMKRFFSGNLENEIGGGICFPGKEAHYLRAQIARISASTNIAPADFYTIQEEDEDDDDEEEEDKVKKLEKNEEYEAKSVKDSYSDGLEDWVHCRHAILNQGRCIPMKVEEEDENEDEEDDEGDDEDGDTESKEDVDPEIFEAKKESEVPLLRSLSEDKAIGQLLPWTLKLTSKLIPETAILIVHSNLWPGAYTYYDGKVSGVTVVISWGIVVPFFAR
ncbi:radial spoke head protein 6 homolog A [Parasteatoda tepidariorum]|uniref:radial spoke head protein 6 homolog A n=1 Tax=Parasteatoda tepidariorum TaxID=114398 RepID=UPI001C723B56|nr:radial spoke head protein 6 homolog A-like [Parasteatoda tepidariorum]